MWCTNVCNKVLPYTPPPDVSSHIPYMHSYLCMACTPGHPLPGVVELAPHVLSSSLTSQLSIGCSPGVVIWLQSAVSVSGMACSSSFFSLCTNSSGAIQDASFYGGILQGLQTMGIILLRSLSFVVCSHSVSPHWVLTRLLALYKHVDLKGATCNSSHRCTYCRLGTIVLPLQLVKLGCECGCGFQTVSLGSCAHQLRHLLQEENRSHKKEKVA